MKKLINMTWQQIREKAKSGAAVILPTSSMEQHGPHMPVKTDTALVTAVAEQLMQTLPADVNAVLAPTLWLGASNHHLPFFAISVNERTYIDVLTQIGMSLADDGFTRLFFLNGHGGNTSPLRLAIIEIRRQRPQLLVAAAEYWGLGAKAVRELREWEAGGMAHASEFEASLLMHLEPASVRNELIQKSVPRWPRGFVRDLIDGGDIALGIEFNRLTLNGTMGDPTPATPEKGKLLFESVVTASAEAITTFCRLDPDDLLADR